VVVEAQQAPTGERASLAADKSASGDTRN